VFCVMYSLRLKKQLTVYCGNCFFDLGFYLTETQSISTVKVEHDQV